METLVGVAWFFTLLSPFAFLVALIPKERLRLRIFLPLATLPGVLLLFATVKKVVITSSCGVLLVQPTAMSLAFTVLGLLLMLHAERKARVFFVYLPATVIASVPLMISLVSFMND